MKYSSFNWGEHRKRGWIFGPVVGRMLTVTRTKHPDWIAWEFCYEHPGKRSGLSGQVPTEPREGS